MKIKTLSRYYATDSSDAFPVDKRKRIRGNLAKNRYTFLAHFYDIVL